MPQLSKPEKNLLLSIAREAVRAGMGKGPAEPVEPPEGSLRQPGGVFVSIHRGSELRGCIGRIASDDPLYRTTAECAVSAAFSDPRFIPLQEEELDEVEFEISLISPPEEIADPERIEIGKHGLLVEKDERRGLLLPQVALAYGWDRLEFLAQTSIKAGLPPDGWRSGARIFVFEALVFDEKSIG